MFENITVLFLPVKIHVRILIQLKYQFSFKSYLAVFVLETER